MCSLICSACTLAQHTIRIVGRRIASAIPRCLLCGVILREAHQVPTQPSRQPVQVARVVTERQPAHLGNFHMPGDGERTGAPLRQPDRGQHLSGAIGGHFSTG
jgi:hypothetical protein